MDIYLAVTPEHQRSALSHTRRLCHVAYRIGPHSTLLREGSHRLTGGLLSLSDREAPEVRNPQALSAALLREVRRQQYGGIAADFEAPPREDLSKLLRLLEKRPLFVPLSYASAVPGAIYLLNSAISGGNYRAYLQEQARCFGAAHLALDAQRLGMRFPLPCPSGVGSAISVPEAERLTAENGGFFSPELCARYTTISQGKALQFLLFDDAETMNRKVRIAQELGFAAAFFQWPEVKDIAHRLRWE